MSENGSRAPAISALAALAAFAALAGAALLGLHALASEPRLSAGPDPRPAASIAAALLALAAIPWLLAAWRAWQRGYARPGPLRRSRLWRLALCGALYPYLLAPLLPGSEHRLTVIGLLAVGAALVGAFLWRVRDEDRAARPHPALRLAERGLSNLALIVVALELGLRLYSLALPSPWTVEADGTPERLVDAYRLTPETPGPYRVNGRGFHDTEFDTYKPAARIRIAALSDSFGVGVVPYEQNVFTVLENELRNAIPGRTVEVYNFSVANASPSTYLALLAGEVQRYSPDLVLVMLFAGNDFEFRRATLLDVNLLYVNRVGRRLWVWLQGWAAGDAAPAGASAASEPDSWTPPALTPEDFLEVERRRFEHVARPGLEARAAPALERLERLIDLSRAPVVLAVAPDEFQVRPTLLARLTEGRTPDPYDLHQAQALAQRLARRKDAVFVDLGPPLVQIETEGRHTFVPNNTHWNALGNRVAAETMARALGPVLRRMAGAPPEPG